MSFLDGPMKHYSLLDVSKNNFNMNSKLQQSFINTLLEQQCALIANPLTGDSIIFTYSHYVDGVRGADSTGVARAGIVVLFHCSWGPAAPSAYG
jgi:hypothetical protein